MSDATKALASVRAAIKRIPDVDERVSHGAPCWFTSSKKSARSFASFANNHHGDGRIALWCAAEAGAQSMLVDVDPARYFVPPYVGVGGWIGVILPGLAPAELDRIVTAAHATIVAKAKTKRR
jgi:hypothetical protein